MFWHSPAPMPGYNMPSQLTAANGSPWLTVMGGRRGQTPDPGRPFLLSHCNTRGGRGAGGGGGQMPESVVARSGLAQGLGWQKRCRELNGIL